ncbi:hypothetical protein KAU11_06560 [Candidatus Babeliales bacterium]|nr:hypothetical protein [Candidatus Babeliales bacterium]
MMTNLLVFAIVVSHSYITPAHTQEECAGTSISSDEVSVSEQPVSQPHGAAPSHKPVPQTRSTYQLKDELADKLIYKAHIASAKAYANVEEKPKAIESYEKAILAAPNEKCREAAIEELNSFSAKQRSKWFADLFTLLRKRILSIVVWVVLILLILPLLISMLLLRRFVRRICGLLRRKKLYRVAIAPTSRNELATYFRDLIRCAHDSFEEQLALVRQIGSWNSSTIVPTFQSKSLLAALPYSLPNVLASKWWAPLAEPTVRRIDPPDYTVDLGVLYTENRCGLTVRLCSRGQVISHWHTSCANDEVPENLQDQAYQVVANIMQH